MAYLPFAYKMGLLQGDSKEAKSLEATQSVCDKVLSSGAEIHVDVPECENVLQELLKLTQNKKDKANACVNMYDVRLRDVYPSCGMNWPPDLANVTPYLRRKDVTEALHVNSDKRTGWQECTGSVSGTFKAAKSKPSIHLLPGLLEEVPIILFSGEQDLICNHIGTEELINNMQWNGGRGFEISPGTWAPRHDWTFEGEAAGIYQEARNLTYILFYNSSHMVPFDYPRRTRDMLDRFLGVDIGTIGGKPADSRIDGEKSGPETSVGGHPNSTVAEEEEASRLEKVKWDAYYQSGEVALIIVIIAAGAWGWWVWRERKRRAGLGYTGLFGGAAGPGGRRNGHARGPSSGGRRGVGLEGFRSKRSTRDVEAADFDESELDDLHVETPLDGAFEDENGGNEGKGTASGREVYTLGDTDDEEPGHAKARS
jgi:carboxypeptidase D